MSIILKSRSLNLLEPSGPGQACNGIALPLTFTNTGGSLNLALANFTKLLSHVSFNLDRQLLVSIYMSADTFLCAYFFPVYALSPPNYRTSLPSLTFYLMCSLETADISLLFIIPPTECACHMRNVYSDIFFAFA